MFSRVTASAVASADDTGVGVSVNVTIANGLMPLLRETKPFFSYTGKALAFILSEFVCLRVKHALPLWNADGVTDTRVGNGQK
jgi:hypothetical protein